MCDVAQTRIDSGFFAQFASPLSSLFRMRFVAAKFRGEKKLNERSCLSIQVQRENVNKLVARFDSGVMKERRLVACLLSLLIFLDSSCAFYVKIYFMQSLLKLVEAKINISPLF